MKTPEEVVDEIDEAIEMIDDLLEDYSEVAEKAMDAGFDLEDIRKRLRDVGDTIDKNYSVTSKQIKAVENWRRGISGWHPDWKL